LILAIVLCLSGATPCRSDIVHIDPNALGTGTGEDWANAFTTISAALTASTSGDELWVRAATYNETASIPDGVSLYGGFGGMETLRDQRVWTANETVIDATGLGAAAVTCLNSTILDGFTVRHGQGDRGGGVEYSGDEILVRNCRIEHNQANFGGGVNLEGAGSILADCRVEKNEAVHGGGVGIDWGDPVPLVRNCLIANNNGSDRGGGVDAYQCRLEGCRIVSNSGGRMGGGVYFIMQGSIRDCTISLNAAAEGGGVYAGSTAEITGDLIAGNRADTGGGIYAMEGYSSAITHCTIVKNEGITGTSGVFVTAQYGGIYLPVTNCILWNRGAEMDSGERSGWGASPTVRHCAVQSGWPGEGNIDAYPEFVDPDGGDWRLANGSPCIDAGTDTGRSFNGTAPDIGAFESPEGSMGGNRVHTPRAVYAAAGVAPGGDGGSWQTAYSSIQLALDVSSTSDEIWVAGGTYAERAFLEPTVTLLGGFDGSETMRDERNWFAHETVIDATGPGGSAVIASDRSTLDGFTITGGSAEYGGGIFLEEGYFALRNTTVRNNRADWGGGGYVRYASVLEVTGCRFVENHGLAEHPLFPLRIGGLGINGESFTIHASVFDGNTGVGFYTQQTEPSRISNSIFSRNKGGGIITDGSIRDTLSIVNCTIVDNTSQVGPAGIRSSAHPTVQNSIVWNGDSDETSGLNIEYSCIGGFIYPGYATIEDPLFVDPEGDDWRLQEGSPLVDGGNPASQWNDACLPPGRGTARNDLGAYGGPGNCDTPVDWGSPQNPLGDLNGDGVVDGEDLFLFMRQWRKSIGPSSGQ